MFLETFFSSIVTLLPKKKKKIKCTFWIFFFQKWSAAKLFKWKEAPSLWGERPTGAPSTDTFWGLRGLRGCVGGIWKGQGAEREKPEFKFRQTPGKQDSLHSRGVTGLGDTPGTGAPGPQMSLDPPGTNITHQCKTSEHLLKNTLPSGS